MMDFSAYFAHLRGTALADFAAVLQQQTVRTLTGLKHGDFPAWCAALQALPDIVPDRIELDGPEITIGSAGQLNDSTRRVLRDGLMAFHPWRKGPFNLFGVAIDSEWRSDLKWARLENNIEPLAGRLVLDVGGGNGYYALRMVARGAQAVVSIDPFVLYVVQFQALNKYIRQDRAAVLPLKIQDLPDAAPCFDTAFSMGVLYHRKDPAQHLAHLRRLLRTGGQFILETLILDRSGTECLTFGAADRYAGMRNVYHLPTPALLESWLMQAGFSNIRCLDITPTTTDEQRRTEWMRWESLPDFLDPANPSRTIEGLPAPVRAVYISRA